MSIPWRNSFSFYNFEYSQLTRAVASEEDDDYPTIVLQPENEEYEERRKGESDKISLEIDKDISVPIITD